MEITFSLDDAYVVFKGPVKSEEEVRNLRMCVGDEINSYKKLAHTTDVDTLRLIVSNQTLRCSSLKNARINDYMEKERIGIAQFAGSKFISCFNHSDHESVPFWMLYGNDDRSKKVILLFQNFGTELEIFFYTDYALIAESRKVCFKGEDYYKRIPPNGNPSDYPSFDMRNCIAEISMFDVEYLESDSSEFTRDYSGTANLMLGDDKKGLSVKSYDPTYLGRHKLNAWDYEKETRLLLNLSCEDFTEWKYIDLRFRPEAFRNLEIILSPWDSKDSLKQEVETIISESDLPDEIKESITIRDSDLKGYLNFPE